LEEESEPIYEPIAQRIGVFEGITVYGTKFKETNTDEIIWQVTLTTDQRPENSDYWISGTEFRRIVQARLLEGFRPVSTFVLEKAPIEPPIAEKQAALGAIAAWENKKQVEMHTPEIL
jgi:hypothetical protein